jgi:hypothetical protein
MRFHFNAISKFIPISINGAGCNANCLLSSKGRRGKGRVDIVWVYRAGMEGEKRKLFPIYAISLSASLFVGTNLSRSLRNTSIGRRKYPAKL